jgi:geranylgeranyl reductase family protein
MEQIEKYDIAICGAGPSGSTCALALEKSGFKIVLIDKSSFPRDKICGDALAAYIPNVLGTINPKYKEDFLKLAKKNLINSYSIVAPNKKKVIIHPKNAEGYTCTRMNLDAFLFDLASKVPHLTVRNNTSIKDVVVNENAVILKTDKDLTIEAKIVIGCDGAHSIINKKLTSNKVELEHYGGAVRAYFKNVSGTLPNTIEFHCAKDITPGYLWIFPMSDNTYNVGVFANSKNISEKKLNLKEIFKSKLETPGIKERFANAERLTETQGFGLPLGSKKVTVSGERFMLCGDAASLIDPPSGEGIGQAIISGRYAGWQALECFKKNDFSASFMEKYRDTLYKKLWNENHKRYLAQRLIDNRPWLFNAVVNSILLAQKTSRIFKRG